MSIPDHLQDLPKIETSGHSILIGEGQVAQKLFFIVKGCVRIWVNKKGKDLTTQFFFEGEGATSLESFLSGDPSPFNIETIEPCTLAVLHKAEFNRLMTDDPEFNKQFYQTALRKQMAHARRLRTFITQSPSERYQSLLTDNPEILRRVPQQYIASFLGITAVSLSRIRARRP